MKLGIIGLPQSGKSTVFEALTGGVTEPAHGSDDRIATIQVPDKRIDTLSAMYRPQKTIYARLEYFLPATAGRQNDHAGDRNPWMAARDCDALIHVIRNHAAAGFEPPSVYRDFLNLDQDLILSDLVVVEKRLERIELDRKRGKKTDTEEQTLLNACRQNLENEIPLRRVADLAAARKLRGFALLSARPMLVLFNNDDEDDRTPQISHLTDTENCIVIRGKLEQELAQMAAEEAADFLSEFNISESAMDKVIRKSYELMGLISFFTVGEDEVRAWTIKGETAAVEAAEAIHSDIKKGFIRAEVLAYDDLLDAGSYAAARKKGTVRLEGKTYTVADGDIINFRFNV